MKIVVLDGFTLNPGDLSWKSLEEQGDLTVYDRTEKALILERIGDAEIIFTNKTPLNREILNQKSSIRYIGVLATGYNVVDVQAAHDAGITVTNIPSYGTTAVAQMTFALLLEICHHTGAHSREVMQGVWAKSPDFCFWNYPLVELAGKTMGIIGFGRIGQNVSEIALALGMNVLAYDMYPDKKLEKPGLEYVRLDELYAKADVVSLHCPLFDETKGMINKVSISKMKKGVFIINTSRGPLINEIDLAEALISGHVASAAVDVLSVEPAQSDNPLMNAPNIIITPHIAWAPRESRERLMNIASENLKAFLSGNPVHTV